MTPKDDAIKSLSAITARYITAHGQQLLIKQSLRAENDALRAELAKTKALASRWAEMMLDARAECRELLDEVQALDVQLQDWARRRTTGGPPAEFTYFWQNERVPHVRLAHPAFLRSGS